MPKSKSKKPSKKTHVKKTSKRESDRAVQSNRQDVVVHVHPSGRAAVTSRRRRRAYSSSGSRVVQAAPVAAPILPPVQINTPSIVEPSHALHSLFGSLERRLVSLAQPDRVTGAQQLGLTRDFGTSVPVFDTPPPKPLPLTTPTPIPIPTPAKPPTIPEVKPLPVADAAKLNNLMNTSATMVSDNAISTPLSVKKTAAPTPNTKAKMETDAAIKGMLDAFEDVESEGAALFKKVVPHANEINIFKPPPAPLAPEKEKVPLLRAPSASGPGKEEFKRRQEVFNATVHKPNLNENPVTTAPLYSIDDNSAPTAELYTSTKPRKSNIANIRTEPPVDDLKMTLKQAVRIIKDSGGGNVDEATISTNPDAVIARAKAFKEGKNKPIIANPDATPQFITGGDLLDPFA
jgi:ribosomal protein S10